MSESYVGKKFGAWTCLGEPVYVARPCPSRSSGIKRRQYIRARCDCGREDTIRFDSLISGLRTSCHTCDIVREKYRKSATKHGKHKTPEWEAWRQMRSRCSRDVRYLGMCCVAWDHTDGFDQFYKDMGSKPAPDYQLDRIDGSKPYSKDNCRWANRHDQMRNIRSNVWLKNAEGRVQCLTDWARELGLGQTALTKRRQRGTLAAIGLEEA